MDERLRKAIWDRIEGTMTSPSHDRYHLEHVLAIAEQLRVLHGGDPEVLTAAVMLHDLGRAQRELAGRESALRSSQLAREILTEINFPLDKRELVCEVISQHDQYDVSPTSREGRILKDADFLAGIGAWGILRSALWTGEKQQGLDRFLERITVKMPARIASLEFPESRRLAANEYIIVELFLSMLEKEPTLSPEQIPGKYVVLEGISGSGKGTQSERLVKNLMHAGRKVCQVAEPTTLLAPILAAWRELLQEKRINDPLGELLLFAGDRSCLISSSVRPALELGHIVVSARSFLSAMVYQSVGESDYPYIAFIHRFVPRPDLIILLDISAQEAKKRILQRSHETGRELSSNEVLPKLITDREKYKAVVQEYFPGAQIIDGARSMEAVERDIWQCVIAAGVI